MGEWSLVGFVAIKLLIIFFWVMCYVIGGRGPKIVRRFLGGISFGLMILGLAFWMGKFNWWLSPLPAAYPIALSIGYGSDSLYVKVLKRGLYGLVFGLIGLYVGMFTGNLYLGVTQLILPIVVSLSLGVFNPIPAVDEEALIALSLVIHIPFMF